MQILDKDGNEMKDEEIDNFLAILSTLGNDVRSPLRFLKSFLSTQMSVARKKKAVKDIKSFHKVRS